MNNIFKKCVHHPITRPDPNQSWRNLCLSKGIYHLSEQREAIQLQSLDIHVLPSLVCLHNHWNIGILLLKWLFQNDIHVPVKMFKKGWFLRLYKVNACFRLITENKRQFKCIIQKEIMIKTTLRGPWQTNGDSLTNFSREPPRVLTCAIKSLRSL